jgi:hypothetical protein
MPEVTTTAPDGTKVTAKPERNVRWAVWVVIVMLPLQLVSRWWVISRLAPSHWCAAMTTAAVQAKTTPPSCELMFGQMLDIYKVAVIGDDLSIVISIVTIVVMLMGAGLNVTVPWGKLGIGADKPPEEV